MKGCFPAIKRLMLAGITLWALTACETQPSPSSSPSQGSSSPPGGSSSPGDEGGSSLPSGSAGIPLPGTGVEPGIPGSPSGTDSQTGSGDGSGDSLEDLDRSLDDSLGTFDDMIMGQSEGSHSGGGEDILGRMGGAETGIDDDSPLYEEAGLDDSTLTEHSARAPTASGGGTAAPPTTSGAKPRGSGGGDQGGSQPAAIPNDVSDGSDDDIVARQLRESALKETDPVLREKLWDEYRKYKNQS